MTAAVRSVLEGGPCPSDDTFYYLRGAGVLSGEIAVQAGMRSSLYEAYLNHHLNAAPPPCQANPVTESGAGMTQRLLPNRVLCNGRHAESECPVLYGSPGGSRALCRAAKRRILLCTDIPADGQVQFDAAHGKPSSDGVTVLTLDLTKIGSLFTGQAVVLWTTAIVAGRQCGLPVELERYWTANASLGPLQRFFGALTEVLLYHLNGSPSCLSR